MTIRYRLINKIKNFILNLNVIEHSKDVDSSAMLKGCKVFSNVNIKEKSKCVESELSGKIIVNAYSNIQKSKLKGTIEIGTSNKINEAFLNGTIKTGNFTSLWGPNLDIISNEKAQIHIGNYCSIARNVTIQSFNHNFKKATSYFIGQNFFKEQWDNEVVSKGTIKIQNDVWIGTHCVVLGGVTINNGAVVAANSVVLSDVPAYSIVAGSPAKVIGYRFSDDIIEKFQKVEWWNWNDDKMKKNKFLFENEIQIEDFDKII